MGTSSNPTDIPTTTSSPARHAPNHTTVPVVVKKGLQELYNDPAKPCIHVTTPDGDVQCYTWSDRQSRYGLVKWQTGETQVTLEGKADEGRHTVRRGRRIICELYECDYEPCPEPDAKCDLSS